MAISSPKERNWWKEPLDRPEIIWISVAFVWGLIMFAAMIYWHIVGQQNLSNEAYRIDPNVFSARAEEMVKKFQVREEGDTGIPVVHPAPGSDVYLVASTWQWYPILELEKDQSYRLHLSSLDWMHGFSLQPVNVNIEVHPNYETVLTIRPSAAGTFGIVCNEYCGIGHHTMIGRIYVVEK